MFRYKRGIRASYNRQGYIYFVSQQYKELSRDGQRKILNLCMECSGEYYQALFEFVTTEATATALSLRHHISRETLYRLVRKYYESFPKSI